MEKIFLYIACGLFLMACNRAQNQTTTTQPLSEHASIEVDTPKIDIVFCLDATGSMSGLIQTAKEKIWSIASSMTQSEPEPDIRIGMVFYRDRGDNFVTKIVPLTYDTDNVYEQLLAIDAAGGGDTPESVNLALSDAVGEMKWRDGQRVYRTIFLVGDCPPHMDYRNEVKYPETCKKANEKGIIINAIKLGNCNNPHFRKIAALSQGEFLQLEQNADDVVIQTPFDDSIQAVSYAIEDSKIYYGDETVQSTAHQRKEKSKQLYGKSSKNSISTRASYNMSKAGKKNWFGEQELLNDIIDEKISIDSIDKDLLPAKLKGLSNENLKVEVEKKVNDRHVQMEKLSYLNHQRQLYIQQQLAKDTTHTSFSEDVYKAIKKQAAKSDIKLKGSVKH